ncbi:MAG: L,D-transpeptidase [Rhodobacteraceae bacterium]|jgi:lipoprotein-anchoring transpeptidase ErfK/SrfK|nr:L,D-transpeptidase [Paracoccaceae bacterium]
MRAIAAALGLGLCLALVRPDGAAAERVEVRVSISRQAMEVFHEGRRLFTWPVSTGKSGMATPKGIYKPWILSRNHRSRQYNNAPMPYAIFYQGGYAIHGTDQERKLGRPASHGCVRLSKSNARILFEMVKAEGMENMRVNIVP